MYTKSTDVSSKSIIKHIKYKLNEQQYSETDTDARRIVDPWILVDRYDSVTPFGMEGQEGPPPFTPDQWRDGHPSSCQDVKARCPTTWRWSADTMEIVALPGSTSDRRFLPHPSLFTICDDNVTAKNFHSTLQSRRRGSRITVYWGVASSSGPEWRISRNSIPPTTYAVKYVITSCGLQISNFLQMTRGRTGQVNTSAFLGSGCRGF